MRVLVDLDSEVTFANQPLGCFRAQMRLSAMSQAIVPDLVGKP
jgi:hypothetical protein